MSYARFLVAVNPIPWKVPPMSVGRKGRGTFVRSGRDVELHSYQEAVRQELIAQGAEMLDPPYLVQFWFYRRLDTAATTSNRKVKMHRADVTNMQKATEDALQGVVIGNDTDNIDVFGHGVEQGGDAPGCVVIEVWGNWPGLEPPLEVQDMVNALRGEGTGVTVGTNQMTNTEVEF